MTNEEIRFRQLTNQYLVTPSDRLTVVRDLCGIRSRFMKRDDVGKINVT